MKLIIITFLGLLTTANKYVLSVINDERSKYNLSKVTYNHGLEKDLGLFDSSWFFENSTEFFNLVPIIYNGTVLQVRNQSLNGQFALYYYPLNKYYDQGFRYLFRDSLKNSIADILSFRAKQHDCFDFKKCSNNSFNEFQTCLIDKPVMVNSRHCSYAFYYFPKFLIRSLTQIACIKLNFAGPAVPINLVGIQNKTFFCYGKHNQLLNDKPFKN